MSLMVHNFVVHRLSLSDDGKLHFIPRSSCFELSSQIETLSQQMHAAYNAKPAKGVGGFSDDNESTFSDELKAVSDKTLEFYDFSVSSGKSLLETLVNDEMVETGFLIFAHYEYLATEYLMICLLDSKQQIAVNQDLNLNYSEQLELSKMQIAVRIDMTQWKITPDQFRYVSFIKGRMGRKVSDFFMKFIGCEEQVDVKQQNKQLMTQVDTYLASQQADPKEKNEHRASVANYYKEQIANDEDVSIKDLAQILPKDEDETIDFEAFNAQVETPLEPSFQPDKTMLKGLAKFSGSGGGVTINFDRNLLGERVIYNPHTDTLMIKGIPPNLKDQLMRASTDEQE